ncbi:MAG TPA: hypothetical protein VMD91_03430 [Candidatus Sulfotelmatobacter sp.]|nr:hypothetical protein [Candidatus Sulfotelmatobacter sp.]
MSEERPEADAHIDRPSRRRDLLALGISCILHALALFVGLLLAVIPLNESASPEGDVNADIIVQEQAAAAPAPISSPAPALAASVAPAPVVTPPPPRPTVPPPVPQPRRIAVLRPRPAPPRPRPPAARRPELSVQRPSAPPQPTAPPELPTQAPQVAVSAPPAPTAPPTVAVVAIATPAPTPLPTRVPTVAPTELPTRPPTLPPTAPPTPAPTPRPVPTAPPATARPTAPPTRTPTLRPQPASPVPTVVPATARPTAVPATAPPATAAPAPPHPTAVAVASAAPVAPPTRAPATVAHVPAPASAPPGTPRPAASGPPASPRPAGSTGPRPGGPKPGAGAQPGHGAGSPRPVRAVTAPAAPGTTVAANPAPAPTGNDANAKLNAKLRSLLPSGPVDTMHAYAGTTPTSAEAKTVIPIPAPILAATFAIIRIVRSYWQPASLTYVYGPPHKNLLGQTVCRGYRIVHHPLPPPPAYHDPNGKGAEFPSGAPDLKPEIDDPVEVPCSGPNVVRVTPGSLATPLPLDP